MENQPEAALANLPCHLARGVVEESRHAARLFAIPVAQRVAQLGEPRLGRLAAREEAVEEGRRGPGAR